MLGVQFDSPCAPSRRLGRTLPVPWGLRTEPQTLCRGREARDNAGRKRSCSRRKGGADAPGTRPGRSGAAERGRGKGASSPSPPSLILNSLAGWRGSSLPHPHSPHTTHTLLRTASAAWFRLERETAITFTSSRGWTRDSLQGMVPEKYSKGCCIELGPVPGMSGRGRRLRLG